VDGLSTLLSLRPPWSGITEARTRLEVEVEAGFVLEGQAPHLVVRLSDHDDLGRYDCGDGEFMCDFPFIPDLPVGGFESLAILSGSVGVVGHGSVLSAGPFSWSVRDCRCRSLSRGVSLAESGYGTLTIFTGGPEKARSSAAQQPRALLGWMRSLTGLPS
jgi:hypothetical protein